MSSPWHAVASAKATMVGAHRRPKTRKENKQYEKSKASNKSRAALGMVLTLGSAQTQGDILPTASIGFAPVGLTLDQTARLNLVNIGAPNGMMITWRFIDASGNTLAQSTVILSYGKIRFGGLQARRTARRVPRVAPSRGASASWHSYGRQLERQLAAKLGGLRWRYRRDHRVHGRSRLVNSPKQWNRKNYRA